MTDKQSLSVLGVEDEPGKVYMIGLSRDLRETERQWFQENFYDMWDRHFQHADAMLVPLTVEASGVIEVDGVDELKDLIRQENETRVYISDRFTDDD